MSDNILQLIQLVTLWLTYLSAIIAFVYCSYTDIRSRRIPNRVTFPMIAIALLVTAVSQQWPSALAGGILAGGIFLVPRLIGGPEKAGMGDVKLAMLGGILTGPTLTLTWLSVTLTVALIVLIPLLIFRKIHLRQTVAFGPFIAIGCLFAIVPTWLLLSLKLFLNIPS